MPRKTIAGLEAEIAHLRWSNNNLQNELGACKREKALVSQQLDTWQRYINTMTVGGEKLADALSHAVGFVTEQGKRR